MISRPTAPRWTFWVLGCALLLKAALPMLATASAQVQGRALVEVCTAYGIATVEAGALGAAHAAAASDVPDAPLLAHAAERCVLGAVIALGVPLPAAAPAAVPAPTQAQPVLPGVAPPAVPDAPSAWAAQLTHAPPGRA